MVKKLLAWSVLAVLVVAPSVLAQDPPQLFNVLTIHTKLGQQQPYENLLKDVWAAFTKAGLDSTILASTSVSDPGAYTFVLGFSSWDEFGEMNAKIGQAYASLPSVMQEIQGTFTHTEQSVWAARPDLSYAPPSPRVADGEGGYTRVAFYYPHPDQALAFEALVGEVIALNKKHSNPNASAAFQLAIGAEGPAYAFLVAAKDEADFFVENAKVQAKMASDMQAILQRGGPMLRKIDYGANVPRPDLTFQP